MASFLLFIAVCTNHITVQLAASDLQELVASFHSHNFFN